MDSGVHSIPMLLSGAAMMLGASPAPPRPDLPASAVVEADISSLQRSMRSRRLSCASVVTAYLDRIAAYDGRGLNAVTAVAPDALEIARSADAQARRGGALPPLFCTPLVVKDNIDVASMATTAGSVALKSNVASRDAPVIAALRSAGAIVLARSNMAEWAFSPKRTISSTAGETANAYALERVPAGSSGGTASAVAASLALAGLGTDTGNSIRGPSSHQALVGMRPTLGRVSIAGVVPLLADHDAVGPMTRTVEDNARLLQVMASTGEGPAPNYLSELRRHPLKGARLGVIRPLADPARSDPEVLRVFERSLAELRASGARVVDVEVPRLQEHIRAGYFCNRFRHDANAYLASSSAEVRDVAEVYRSGRYAPQSKRQFEGFLEEGPGSGAACPSFASNAGRQRFRADVVRAMDESGVSALLYPTWTYPPAARTRAEEDYRGDNSQLIAPSTGLPAITVPMGATRGTLPAGLQWLGRPYAEGVLYGLTWSYTRAHPHRAAPTGFPPLQSSAP